MPDSCRSQTIQNCRKPECSYVRKTAKRKNGIAAKSFCRKARVSKKVKQRSVCNQKSRSSGCKKSSCKWITSDKKTPKSNKKRRSYCRTPRTKAPPKPTKKKVCTYSMKSDGKCRSKAEHKKALKDFETKRKARAVQAKVKAYTTKLKSAVKAKKAAVKIQTKREKRPRRAKQQVVEELY